MDQERRERAALNAHLCHPSETTVDRERDGAVVAYVSARSVAKAAETGCGVMVRLRVDGDTVSVAPAPRGEE